MPKILRPIHILAPTLLASLAAGCESSTLSRVEAAGTFALESIAGVPVPVTTHDTGTARYITVADTIRLEPDGDASQTVVFRLDFADPTRLDEESRTVANFRYRVRGDRVIEAITDPCPPNALCPVGPHILGRHEGDALVRSAVDGADNVILYRRVAD